MRNDLLNEYKKLPEIIKNNLVKMLAYDTCYNRDRNMSDEMVDFISNKAYNCWIEDNNNNSIVDYVDYLLSAVYDYKAKKGELEDVDIYDIISNFNDEEPAESILRFRNDDYTYMWTTTDGFSCYCNEDGLYVLNKDGRCVSEGHPMEDSTEKMFDILRDKEISDMPLDTHYDIRCAIENDIMGDSELEDRYKEGIEKYKNYCLKNFITKEDIVKAVKLYDVIALTEIDGEYTSENKIKRLSKYFDKYRGCSYVASLDNGTDYYYKNNKYFALDKNNVIKEFPDKKHFLLNELKDKYIFAYISDRERKKIAKEIEDDYHALEMKKVKSNNLFSDRTLYSVDKFMNYEKIKEVDDFQDKLFEDKINNYFIMNKKINSAIKEKTSQVLKAKNKGLDK